MANLQFQTEPRELPAGMGKRRITDLSEEELDRLIFLGAKAAMGELSDEEQLEYRLASRAIEPLPLTGPGTEGFRPDREEEFGIVSKILREGGLPVPDEHLRAFIRSTDATFPVDRTLPDR